MASGNGLGSLNFSWQSTCPESTRFAIRIENLDDPEFLIVEELDARFYIFTGTEVASSCNDYVFYVAADGSSSYVNITMMLPYLDIPSLVDSLDASLEMINDEVSLTVTFMVRRICPIG